MKERILIVEDERAIQIALSALLRKEGYEVDVAPDGVQAIARIEAGAYDLVLTDLALGEGPTGLQVLEAAKRARPGTPVVLITAHGSEKVAVDAMKAGAEDYVPKPFDNDEIRLVVQRALARLTERQRRVVVLRHFDDLTERETADLLGVTVGTVKSQNAAALARLREGAPELWDLIGGRR